MVWFSFARTFLLRYMDNRFVKSKKVDTDGETQGLRQSADAAAIASDASLRKLPRNDRIDLKPRVLQYC